MVDWGTLPKQEPRRSSVCFIVDGNVEVSESVTRAVRECGVEPCSYSDTDGLQEALSKQAPEALILEVSLASPDAVEIIRVLGNCGYEGRVQLVSNCTNELLDAIRRIGERYKLNMLPILPKLFQAEMIRRILSEEGTDAPAPVRGFLGEALRAGWVEFWYQPTIDLRSRRTVGVEALCRVRHPQMGLLTPDRFLPSADPSERTRLVELSIVTALYDIKLFSGFGLDFRVAVNMPIEALHSLSIPALLRACGSRERTDTHLTFEIPEAQLEGDLSALQETATQLSTYGISLAIDHFGCGEDAFAKLRKGCFSEVKIDRQFVVNCGIETANKELCGSVVDAAHEVGCVTMADGIESIADLQVLYKMGCDFGQGLLFASPMPMGELLATLRGGVDNAARGLLTLAGTSPGEAKADAPAETAQAGPGRLGIKI
ncbi:MAG: EAL domain-containing protein [Rhizomicrobium sp.]